MKNKDNINMFQLHLEILQNAEKEVFIYEYEEETEYCYGYITFFYKGEDYSMLFDKGTLKEIRKGIV